MDTIGTSSALLHVSRAPLHDLDFGLHLAFAGVLTILYKSQGTSHTISSFANVFLNLLGYRAAHILSPHSLLSLPSRLNHNTQAQNNAYRHDAFACILCHLTITPMYQDDEAEATDRPLKMLTKKQTHFSFQALDHV